MVDGAFNTYETIESSEFTEWVDSSKLDEPFESSLESMSEETHCNADDDYVFIKSKKRKDGKSNRHARNIKREEEMKKEAENTKKNMMKNLSKEMQIESCEETNESEPVDSSFRTFLESFMKAI